MTDAERLYNVIEQTLRMIKARQRMHEESAKNSGASGKRANGNRARECATILEQMYKIVLENEHK